MDIGVTGLIFYNPSVSVSTRYFKDNDENTVGQKDTVSITDTVLSSDNPNLLTLFDSAFSFSLTGSQKSISYPGNPNTYGVVKSVSVDTGSDFVNKLIYTIVIEAIPLRPLYSKYGSSIISGIVSSLTETESWDVPYDMMKINIPTSNGDKIYYNKPITYNYSLQVSCGKEMSGDTNLDNANKIMQELGRTKPSSGLVNDLSNYLSGIITSINKNSSSDGSQSLNITTLYLPNDSSGTLLVNEEITEFHNSLENYTDRSYKIMFTSIQGSLLYNTGTDKPAFSITGVASGLSNAAHTAASGLMQYFIDTSGITTISGTLPGRNLPCVLLNPKLTQTGCWNTRSVSLENNISNNSASLNIEQTTQNLGNCDLNGYKINYSIGKQNRDKSRIYAEAPGWSSTGYWVQDMNTFKDNVYEYNIDVASIKKCAPTGTGIIDKAKSIFTGIDILQGSGIITSYTINVSDNSCSLKITQYSGEDQSYSGIGYTGT